MNQQNIFSYEFVELLIFMNKLLSKTNVKQQIQNVASEIYSNEVLVFFIFTNSYVTIQSIHDEGRLFCIYKKLIEFEMLDDFTIYFVNCISNVEELFCFFTLKEQPEFPLFNQILRNQQGTFQNLFNLMEMRQVNKLWLCYQWIGFSQVDLIQIIEKIDEIHIIIKENWIRLEKINQTENPEILEQEVSIIISLIQRVLK